MSREAIKRLEVVSEEIFINWKGTPDSLIEKDLKTNQLQSIGLYSKTTNVPDYVKSIIEEPYLEEIVDFIAGIKNKNHSYRYSYKKDKAVIKLMDVLEA